VLDLADTVPIPTALIAATSNVYGPIVVKVSDRERTAPPTLIRCTTPPAASYAETW